VRGSSLAALAWRNIWRNRRRTLLTLVSIGFGSMLAVLFTGMQNSQFGQMVDLAARLGGGHVTLQHFEYLDTPTLTRTVHDAAALREVALHDPDVDRVVERISGFVMLSTAGQNYGAAFIAFDPAAEDATTLSLIEAVSEGEMFRSAGDKGIILGKRLAENLEVKLGRKVVYTLTDKHGEIVRDVARVSAIVRTGSPSVDAGLCMFPIDSLRETLRYAPDEGIQVAVFLRDQRRADALAARLTSRVEKTVSALPWHEIQPDLAGFIAMKVAGMVFFEVLIMVLVAAGIFNTLFMSVMERLREFGIMMAIGYSPASLFRLVMLESLWLGVVGLVVGAALTAWPYYYLTTTGLDLSSFMGGGGAEIAGVAAPTTMHVSIFPENLVAIGIAVLLATLVSGLYPAWQAGRVVPVESIRLV
jgi:ABC-type lipoprotein release transport system permease subunit